MAIPNTALLGLDRSMCEQLQQDFDPAMIYNEPPAPDGFRPLAISWTDIQERLDRVFNGGWSFIMVNVWWLDDSVVVQGRLSVSFAVTMGDSSFPWTIEKDGTGSCRYTLRNGVAVNRGYDLNTAKSLALRNAAVLFGVALNQLYREPRRLKLQQAQENQAIDSGFVQQRAQPFQVDQAVQYLEGQCGISRDVWMRMMGITSPEQLTQSHVSAIFSGQVNGMNLPPLNGGLQSYDR